MTKNEIVARWMGFVRNTWPTYKYGVFYEHPDKLGMFGPTAQDFKYDSDYNWLHEAWVKFRDLKVPISEFYTYSGHCTAISNLIVSGTITEAFDKLVSGIIWVESLNTER